MHETNDTKRMYEALYTHDMADKSDLNKRKICSVNWSERDRVILVQRVYEKEERSPRISFGKFRGSRRDLDEVLVFCNAYVHFIAFFISDFCLCRFLITTF